MSALNEKTLIALSREFARPDDARAWRLLGVTVLVYALFFAGTAAASFQPLKAILSVFLGLTGIRLFIFFHDAEHGAIFRGSKLGRVAVHAIGVLSCSTPTIWKEYHDRHHRTTARSIGISEPGIRTGDFLSRIVRTDSWDRWTANRQRMYRTSRHWLAAALGYLAAFLYGACIAPLLRDPRRNWQAAFTLIAHLSWLTAIVGIFGWSQLAWLALVPASVSAALGAWLFYAQHAFPGVEYQDGPEFDWVHAALKGSSMFDMPKWMHWFTGNIGYHHVHHLNPTIPFFRLPNAMAAIPELQNPLRTSWHPRDILACISIHAWDPVARKAVPLPRRSA